LQELVEIAQANPLRKDKVLEDLPKKVADLQRNFRDLRSNFEAIPDRLEKERRAIIAARPRESDAAAARLQLNPPDANALTAYLLSDQTAMELNVLVGWLRWMRDVVPAREKPPASVGRGENVLFAGTRQGPALLIRSLEMNGSARIAGPPIELRGRLSNFASE